MPTGGGKTLSSLAFALRHAALYGLRRVIYVIPYMSIIEQNARVFREVLGDEAVVEHHSTFTPGSLGQAMDEDSPSYRRARLASENWDAPVVVTTNVQFFESLFADRSSRCRKLHNVAGSVVVLDEAQMLPVEYLRPCLEALRELTANYGTSVVLCTATQPALSTSPSFPDGLDGVREIVTGLDGIEEAFDRVELEDAGTLSTEALAQALAGERQTLCIVNTRSRAAELFALLRERPGARHLSARMCPAHRSLVLDGIRADLAAGRPCLTVSTQLVEAGVDVDFPLVYRELAGLDSIAQAAGRCNREGLLGEGRRGLTRVFRHEAGLPRMFRPAADSAQSTLRRFEDAPFSARAVRDYFANYYWRRVERLDSKGILAALSADVDRLNFPFRDVAQAFRLIENDMLPVIVPWGDAGEALVEELRHVQFPGSVLRRLQRFTVQVYRHEFRQLDAQGALEIVDESYAVLVRPESYRDDLGLVVDTGQEAANYIL
ncbi:CRISPR-associated helicase Cas3' [Desulfocurvus vexinensis]|uniref:CRISPR-associated helicase Cas3' n=1 Tax=Desulfocurvus vexinensis TaxID=399548 RepID=UPI001FE05650|nr:CRISPR-associated helicase Cas3' [Desulfocurvus vexinensis]